MPKVFQPCDIQGLTTFLLVVSTVVSTNVLVLILDWSWIGG